MGNSSTATTLRSFFVRVALIVTVLAVPLVGTSYVLVSQVDTSITMTRAEHTSLANFARIVQLFSLLEVLHDRISSRDSAAITAARQNVDRALAAAQRTYDQPPRPTQTPGLWTRLGARWAPMRQRPTVAGVLRVLVGLNDIGNDLDNDSPLDVDPDFAVQNLSATILRQEPRSIVALRQTAQIAGAIKDRLTFANAEAIARQRALEEQALERGFGDIASAVELAPGLHVRFAPAVDAALRATAAFERRIDAVLVTHRTGRVNAAVERAARAAISAHLALWRVARQTCDDRITNRLEREITRRRITIALACVALVAGAFAITFVSRYEARRDRLELSSTRLEAQTLRVELTRISVERALRLQEAQFRAVFENADLGIAVFDRAGNLLQENPAVERMLGPRSPALLRAQRATVLEFQAPHREPLRRDECHPTADQREQWLSFTFSAVYDEDVCQMVILLVRDATEEKLLAQQLGHDATHDGLTGIANRSAFERALREEFATGRPRRPFAVMFIDLDEFKPINDTFGHDAGDHVLMTMAQRLRSVIGADDLCARLGGDEFAVLLLGVHESETIEAIAQRSVASLALPINYEDRIELFVSASIGIAIASEYHRSAEELKKDADSALYSVKQRGRNGYSIHQRQPLTALAGSPA